MILTDELFGHYGGLTGTSTAEQRQVAYEVAEQQIVDYLGFPLSPETFTGTFAHALGSFSYDLPHRMVRSIIHAEIVPTYPPRNCIRDITDCVLIVDNAKGIIGSPALGHWVTNHAASMSLVYEAGLDSGSFSSDSQAMLALVGAAQIIINELVMPGMTEVRIGIQSFTNMKYTEHRTPLHENTFGSGAPANYVRVLLKHLRVGRVGRV